MQPMQSVDLPHILPCSLRTLGLEPATKATMPSRKFPFVAFTAPPSGSTDYLAEVRGHGHGKGAGGR